MPLWVTEDGEGCIFYVRVVPRGRKDEIVGLHDGALKIRLTAPPVGGKANRALGKFLARRLRVSPREVEIIGGHTSRHKRVRVHGITAKDVLALVSNDCSQSR